MIRNLTDKNFRWFCPFLFEDPTVSHTKSLKPAIVYGVLRNERHMISSRLYPEGLSVNSAAYIRVLETGIKLWIDTVHTGRPYVFQQDSTPSHKAQVTQMMADNFNDHITPTILPI